MRQSSRHGLRLLKRHLRFAYFRLILLVYRLSFSTISNFDDKYIVESVRRKQWFYRSKYPVFSQRHYIGISPDVSAEDVAIASEVQSYWRKLSSTTPPNQTVWSLDLQGAQDLVNQLNSGDISDLAVTLNGMFHSSYIQGISHGFRHKEFPSSKLLVPVVTEDRLVSLGEYLGVIPAETSEQGICGVAMAHGLESVVKKIEDALEFSISFPKHCGASGIRVGDRVISKRQVEHIYAACRLKSSFDTFGKAQKHLVVTEIGGGYGGLCLWIQKVFQESIEKYYIVDLPWVNTFQAYFLKRVLGKEKVAFWNDDVEKVKAATVVVCSSEDYQSFMPTVAASHIYLNQDSLPEMPAEIARKYLEWIFSKTGALFFSYQQENGISVKNSSQSNVHELLRPFKSARLKCRNLSWTRDGYTEETYEVV